MILDEICSNTRSEVAQRIARISFDEVQAKAQQVPPPRDFAGALAREGMGLIAEIKRASPSKGVMRGDIDPAELALTYEQSGASAISVLTDTRYFKGHIEDLVSARSHVAIPCLRKDFIVDAYQIYEARAAEADAILLIVRALSDAQLAEFLALAHALGIAALVETHSAIEVERALAAGARIIGVNNRDLATFQVDIRATIELRPLVPEDCLFVSESGIHTREDVRMLEQAGVDAILVGEALVKSGDIARKIQELLGRGED